MAPSIILIPALNPGERLVSIVRELKEAGMENIFLVDDGSGADHVGIFSQAEAMGCTVITHPTNLGKGAALKTGIKAAVERFGEEINVITADSDGQHKVSDIVKVAQAVSENPDRLVLGTRDFTGPGVPARSRFGNGCTSRIFKFTTGVKCRDTQTGLRGIPASLIGLALETEGSRYEYEMNYLTAVAGVSEFYYVPIETIYEDGNSVSHFRPIRDSIRVYGRFFRFMASSLSGLVVDYIFFFILIRLLPTMGITDQSQYIVASTVIARIFSGIVNFTLNKNFAFKSNGNTAAESIRYLILFLCQMGTSAGCTAALSFILPVAASKVIVDTSLFFVSFTIQKKWVFRER